LAFGGPEGNDTVQPREISIQGEPGDDIRTVVVVSITPCLFKKEGDHVMVLELGDQTFERPFGVRMVEELPKQGSSIEPMNWSFLGVRFFASTMYWLA